jgi:hypothetical protein
VVDAITGTIRYITIKPRLRALALRDQEPQVTHTYIELIKPRRKLPSWTNNPSYARMRFWIAQLRPELNRITCLPASQLEAREDATGR